MDVEAIALGMDFVEAIENSLADCGALLVLIGKDWANCKDPAGVRRLEKDDDFVRTEVAKALERKIRVIPVLVKGAPMPKVEDLPEDLKSLTRRQASELRHERWDPDVEHLASTLEKILAIKRIDKNVPPPPDLLPTPKKSSKTPAIIIAMVALFFILGILVYNQFESQAPMYRQPKKSETTPEPEATKPATVKVTPAKPKAATPAPKEISVTNITGVWIDDDDVQVEILQTGTKAFSQAFDPNSGLLIQTNWLLNGRQCEFTWRANSGNYGYGQGHISTDYKVINYEFVDYTTGLRDTGRLVRTAH